MSDVRRFQELKEDPRLKTRVKVENYLLVQLGMRPCSQTTMPVDLPSAEEMGSTIDRMMSPKMGQIKGEPDPRRRLAAIASLKKEMRAAYNQVVKASEQYRAHLDWAAALRFRTRVVDVRPTVQEMYVFKERRLGEELKRLMKELYQEAQQKVEEILATPQKHPLPDDVIGKLEAISRRAEEELE